MVHAPVALHCDRERPECFGWSCNKIRRACFVLLVAATPAVFGFAVPVPLVKWLCLAWLTGVALFMHGLLPRIQSCLH